MGHLIREYDWSKSVIGPVQSWPQSLQSALSICLNSNFPIAIYWGQELILIYNDAWSSIPGKKHPWALGQPAHKVWPEIWDAIQPQFEKAFNRKPGGSKDALLPMQRHGYTEECYFDFTFTPVFGENGKVEGIFNAVIETTYRVINERRTAFLQKFSNSIVRSQTLADLFQKAIAALKTNAQDIPYSLIYSISKQGEPVLEASTITEETGNAIKQEWPADKIYQTGKPVYIPNISDYFVKVPAGFWPEPPKEALVCPTKANDGTISGFIVVGISSRRGFDKEYQSFLESIAGSVSTVINTIRSFEEERKRAEALAEIDRAKTTFFSNISHEFRTPLTLLLGPVEEAFLDQDTTKKNKVRMDLAYRNALRLQKLVNTLMEFSRIEAGRIEGKFSRVDICTFTKDLASTFRSAIEKAGMQLHLHCGEVKEEVYVDTEMWEKIILNLVSNAFKYSKEGMIELKVMQVQDQLHVTVADTGVGIPEDQLDKIFNRFYRIENTQGRSQEGTGIGLAMVKELVKLHQGTISVVSQPGKGAAFTVSIPVGKSHLPADKILEVTPSAVPMHSEAFVQEAMKWLPGNDGHPDEYPQEAMMDAGTGAMAVKQAVNNKKYKVLLADDNADMRAYMQRLLADEYQVITAINGEDALTKMLLHKPDLLVSDVMMPKLDGFELLKTVRSHPEIKNTPVIILSARAGEEAKVEGLDAGADDYLVKPFSAKELLARVDANIRIAKNRIATEKNLHNVIMQSPVATVLLRGASFIIEIVNEKALESWGRTYDEVINKPIAVALPQIAKQGFDKILQEVYTTGIPFRGNEVPVELIRFGNPETIYVNYIYEPLRNDDNTPGGIIAVGIDVSEQVLARQKIEQSQRELNELANAMPQLVWVTNPIGEVTYFNSRLAEFTGAAQLPNGNWSWQGLIHPDDLPQTLQIWQQAVEQKTIFQFEHRVQMKDGTYRWHLSRSIPQKDEQGNVLKWFGTTTDIHISREHATILEEEVKKRTAELRELNLSLQKSNDDLQQFAHVASHDLKEPLRKIRTFMGRLAEDPDTAFSDKAITYLEKIDTATNRMRMMIEGVLSYSTVESTDQIIELVNLNDVMRNIESDFELLIAQKSAALHYPDLSSVEGAPVLLYQLFYNLINNALKFSKTGVPPRIAVSSSVIINDQKEYARIRVEDNGIGFEQNNAEHIFSPFARLNSKDRYEGTGLGLSLCRKIVQRHKGTIEAVGTKGQGAVFIIQLPLKQVNDRI